MSAEESPPARVEAPAPPMGVRRLWWWSIYCLGCLGLVAYNQIHISSSTEDGWWDLALAGLLQYAFTLIFLPLGLGADFTFLLGRIADMLEGHGIWLTISAAVRLLEIFTLPLGFSIYILHATLVKSATTQQAFCRLILSLVLIVLASVIGCIKFSRYFTH